MLVRCDSIHKSGLQGFIGTQILKKHAKIGENDKNYKNSQQKTLKC